MLLVLLATNSFTPEGVLSEERPLGILEVDNKSCRSGCSDRPDVKSKGAASEDRPADAIIISKERLPRGSGGGGVHLVVGGGVRGDQDGDPARCRWGFWRSPLELPAEAHGAPHGPLRTRHGGTAPPTQDRQDR